MPRLKEFGLDLPYRADTAKIQKLMEEKSLEYQQATKLDYELNWKAKRREFALQTRCISAFFERCFKPFNTDNCWKILVNCVPDNPSGPKVVGGVYEVELVFSIDTFFHLNDGEKKKIALEMLSQGIGEIIAIENWDTVPFQSAHSEIITHDYLNLWIWKSKKYSPDKRHYAYVQIEHNVHSCEISIIIHRKENNERKAIKVISAKPDEWDYAKYLGELKWISQNEVVLFAKDRDISFKAFKE